MSDTLGIGDLGQNSSTTQILLEIRNDVKRMNKKFDGLDKKVKELKKDNRQLQQQNQNLSKQVTELTTTVIGLETRVKETEMKNERIEAQSRRENLKFYGVDDDSNETWDQSEQKIRTYLRDGLEIDDVNIKIERAHRLPSKSSPRPIIVKFSHFKDKDQVLKTYRIKRKERQAAVNENSQAGENGNEAGNTRDSENGWVRVSEDFPVRVSKARSKLYPFLKACHDKEQQAYLRYDTLVVDGQAYVYDEVRERPVPVK
ncbi:MAG: hypothetical protein N0E48_03320 [Candidatus Thiodiazotropha endolucinida]|nr:hypothetical protein [Candidatus Thiodiazotropha taylori]MCW4342392.1 hypothetical protein [Candidatus Thiodiazotropha endolucinida]